MTCSKLLTTRMVVMPVPLIVRMSRKHSPVDSAKTACVAKEDSVLDIHATHVQAICRAIRATVCGAIRYFLLRAPKDQLPVCHSRLISLTISSFTGEDAYSPTLIACRCCSDNI